MNSLLSFENQQVEVLEVNGTIYFNPYHIANILDIKNVRDNLRTMNENQVIKLTQSIVGNADIRKLHSTGELFLTESGVYKLIFKSRKPNAERFADWVTDEVLPSIRKTGKYESGTKQLAIVCKTYKGVPVMTTSDLAAITGLDYDAIRKRAQKTRDYRLLKSEALESFKEENQDWYAGAKHVAIFGKESALTVLAYYKKEDYKPIVMKYFSETENKVLEDGRYRSEQTMDEFLKRMYVDFVENTSYKDRYSLEADLSITKVRGFGTVAFMNNQRLQNVLIEMVMDVADKYEESGFIAGVKYASRLFGSKMLLESSRQQNVWE